MNPDYERAFTSTASKLLRQEDRFGAWRSGIFDPISLQLAPTDKCNLKCDFCSVANRQGNELAFDQILKAVDSLKRKGLQTVEITGGGEPTLYPFLNGTLVHLIDYCGLSKKVGLITNGIALTRSVESRFLPKLAWIRISLNSLDYVDHIDLPERVTTIGFSYVVGPKTTRQTILKISSLVDSYHPDYVRLVPNCLSEESAQESQQIAVDTGAIELDRSFMQTKSRRIPNRCWMGYLKPFLAPDGFFYHCSANPLIDRKFNPEFRMGRWDQVDEIWNNPTPFNTEVCHPGKCFFAEHNEVIEMIRASVAHPSFL